MILSEVCFCEVEMHPLVSIIMPTYNSENTIEDSINSVINQTYTNWELLITDDCSTDATLTIIKRFSKSDDRIKLLCLQSNSGAGVARNNSIAHSAGRFIAFLDSDDMWHREKLEKQVHFMLEHNYGLTYTHYVKIDANKSFLGAIHPPQKVDYSTLLKSNVIGCLTAMYDTKILGKVFMPAIRKRQDMALWLKILEKVDYAWCLPEELAYYLIGHDSLSSNKIKIITTQWRFYRSYLHFNFFKSAWYFSFYAYYALQKHSIKKNRQNQSI